MQTPAILNGTKAASNSKVDCAKECPCGVAALPVPDQWLEVMVVGGFKVWHIIFIIIAFIISLVVVYCCFHRCRIPRTKQEIEADLMRSNLTSKFREYLQELPNEQTTFLDALKKVQEIEEKLEKDGALLAQDASARKRLGWLKLKGKGGGGGGAGGGQEKEVNDQATGEKELAPPVEPPVETKTSDDLLNEVVTTNGMAAIQTATTQEVASPGDVNVTTEKPSDAVVDGLDAVDVKTIKQLRRRKQKPNLSRTKRTRDRSEHLDQPELPTETIQSQTEPQVQIVPLLQTPIAPDSPLPDLQLPEAVKTSPTRDGRSKERRHKSTSRKEASEAKSTVPIGKSSSLHQAEPSSGSNFRSTEVRKYRKRPNEPR